MKSLVSHKPKALQKKTLHMIIPLHDTLQSTEPSRLRRTSLLGLLVLLLPDILRSASTVIPNLGLGIHFIFLTLALAAVGVDREAALAAGLRGTARLLGMESPVW